MKHNPSSSEIPDAVHEDILSLGALFDGAFSIDWLMELTGLKASRLMAALDAGMEQGFISRSAPGTFYFRDKARQSELLSHMEPEQKELISRRLRDIMMRAEPDEMETTLTLARHLFQNVQEQPGPRRLIRLGDTLRRGAHPKEASLCYKRAIIVLGSKNDTESNALYIEAVLKYARILPDANDPDEIIQTALAEAIIRSRKISDSPSEVLLRMHLGEYEWYQGRFNTSTRHFHEGWEIALKTGNPAILRSALIFRIFFLWWQGRYHDIVTLYEDLVPEVDKYPTGSFAILSAALLGSSYVACGKVAQGFGLLNGLFSHCQTLNSHENIIKVALHLGLSFIEIGRIDKAIAYFEMIQEKGLDTITFRLKNAALGILSYAYLMKNDYQLALEYFPKSLTTTHALKVSGIRTHYIFFFLMLMEKGKLPKVADVSMEKMIEKVLKTGNIHARGVGYLFKARMMEKEGKPPKDILKPLKLAMNYTKESGHVIQLAKMQLECARMYVLLGDENNAKKLARKGFKVLEPINKALIPEDLLHLLKIPVVREDLLDEIIRLGQEVVSIRDNRELVQRILSTVNQITGAERGAIFMVDGNQGDRKIELKAAKFLTVNDVAHEDFIASMKIIEQTIETGTARVVQMEGYDDALSLAPNISRKIKSCFCVPMIYKNKIVGALYHDYCLFSSTVKASDLETLSYFAGQAAIALDNAQAYEQIQRLNEKLEGEKEYYLEQHLKGLQYNDFIGNSPKIQKVFNQIKRVSGEDTTVLILGETGVGKELIARIIHRESKRNEKPFIRTDCSTLSPALIASELFGHEKGAFTGATHRRTGLFELANGGTLFLDEISNTPMDVQMQLLRVLQTHEFQRVGGFEPIQSNFRLITASNRDLKDEVKAGRFRDDLYYRLNVFPVVLPPLRERTEDIPLLALFFLKQYAAKMRKPLEEISKQEMEKLLAYPWPGNVRELQHVIERGVILSSESYFRVPELAALSKEDAVALEIIPLDDAVRNHILKVLAKTGGKISGKGGAAELLDVNYGTLRSKMKKLGIQMNKQAML
jgi:transcriptional regulator with GAF, ATPase, and Fis domain